MDKKLYMSPQDLWIISTIKFSGSDIKCLEKWVVKKEMMMVTCPWFPHVARGKGKKAKDKFEKIYCKGKCYEIFSNSLREKKCPCWVHDLDYVIEMVLHIIGSNRPWHERLMRWLNGISM